MTWPVRVMCAVLEVSAGGYYEWRNRAESKRTMANRQLLGEIRRIHLESSGTYGNADALCGSARAGRAAPQGENHRQLAQLSDIRRGPSHRSVRPALRRS
jgi:putative transposase